MGKSTIRARIRRDDKGNATVRTLIEHPMRPEQVDPDTGALQAPHLIEVVEITLNGEPLLTLAVGQGVSTNPLFSFALGDINKGDALGIRWRDNRGESDEAVFSAG